MKLTLKKHKYGYNNPPRLLFAGHDVRNCNKIPNTFSVTKLCTTK